VAAIIAAEKASTDAEDALRRLREADYDVAGTPYELFVRKYFTA